MALFPCDESGHRYSGSQQTIYPAVAFGTDSARRKLRLCPDHFTARLETLERSAYSAQLDFVDAQAAKCLVCHKPVSDSAAVFFATVYASKTERVDYWAPLHSECTGAAAEDWSIPV